MNLLPDNEPQTAVQQNVSAPFIRSQKGKDRPPLFGLRTTAKIERPQVTSPPSATLPGLPAELISSIGADLDPVELRNLAATSVTLARTVDTREWKRIRRLFYGKPGSLQAMAHYRHFSPLYNRFGECLYRALLGQWVLSECSHSSCAQQSEITAEQMLDCAAALRIKSQKGALKPVVRSFRMDGIAGSACWTGSIAGVGHCRIECPVRTGEHGLFLPLQLLEPNKGPFTFTRLELPPIEDLGESTNGVDGQEAFPAAPLKVMVMKNGTVIARHPAAVYVWRQNNCAEMAFELDELPVKNSTVVTEVGPERIAIGRHCGNIQIWSLSPKRRLRSSSDRLHSAPITGLIGLPDGRFISASGDGMMMMWRPDEGDMVASQRIPKEEGVSGLEAISPDRFISRSLGNDLRVWQITESGFHCIALLDPFSRNYAKKGLYSQEMLERLRYFWSNPPYFVQDEIIVLANSMVMKVTSRRDLNLELTEDIAPLLSLYDLNAPQSPHDREVTWRNTDNTDTTVPIWEPRPLFDAVCNGTKVLLKAFPDGRIVVVSSRRVVIYEPTSDHVLEVPYDIDGDDTASEDAERPARSLTGGCVTDEGFIWLYDSEGGLFVIDLLVDINHRSNHRS